MDTRLFDHIAHEHGAILARLADIDASTEKVLEGPGSPANTVRQVALAAADAVLALHARAIEPLMAAEEAELHPALDRYLTAEGGPSSGLLEDHETIRSIVALLCQARERLMERHEGAEGQVLASLKDLQIVVRGHIHREDDVIHPLLARLMAQSPDPVRTARWR